ncbi:MAG: YncE family protein [Chloroflexi bacterium]|nr:YncE family protein [Chloroflexota bacterium]
MNNVGKRTASLGVLAVLGLIVLVGPLLFACTRPSSAPGAAPAAKESAPTTIVQVAQPAPGAPAPAPAATGWQTPAAQKVGIKLLQTLDSSGPPAFDAKKHPMVLFTSNGPGYAGLPSAKVKLPGLTVIDGKTKEVVTARWFDLKTGAPPDAEFSSSNEPHGLGVSMDGKWIYLPTADPTAPADDRGRLLVINAQTLKLHQVIGTQRSPHHVKGFQAADGRQLILGYDFNGSGIYILDPNNDNKVVAVITDEDVGGRRYLAFSDPKGENIWASVRPAAEGAKGWVSVISTKDWKVKKNYTVGESPIWVVFTADGKYAFVDNGHDDTYHKIDVAKGQVVGEARVGGHGPYGMTLSWDEKELWFINKGEGSHNRGKTISYVNPVTMGRPIDEFYTGCVRGDHIYLHPDPQANEFWLSCNSSFEIVVFDSVKKEVKTRIPMPDGGSTHTGAFVQYDVDSAGKWKGEVLVGHDGPSRPLLAKRAELAALAAQKK